MSARAQLAQAMTERDLQSAVVGLAQLRGWYVQHSRPARRADGSWSTPISGDPGFPDLVLARRGAVLFIELKAQGGRLSDRQLAWLAELPDELRRVWRPEHWQDGTIARELA